MIVPLLWDGWEDSMHNETAWHLGNIMLDISFHPGLT